VLRRLLETAAPLRALSPGGVNGHHLDAVDRR
jgi:hypothetical protein